MPTYEYTCSTCNRTTEAVRTVANRNRAPKCCGKATHKKITTSYAVRGAFTEYRAMGPERPYIKTRQEHRDYLRRHGYEEVGNDRSFAPPPDDPVADAAKEKEMADSLSQLKHTQEIANV